MRELRALLVEEPAIVITRAPCATTVHGLIDVFTDARGLAEVVRRAHYVDELTSGHLNAVPCDNSVGIELEDMRAVDPGDRAGGGRIRCVVVTPASMNSVRSAKN